MTSVLNVDTIADKAGTGPVALTKQAASKHFVAYDAINQTVEESLNQSTLTDQSEGRYYSTFTNAMSGAAAKAHFVSVHNSTNDGTSHHVGDERGGVNGNMGTSDGSSRAFSASEIQFYAVYGSSASQNGQVNDYSAVCCSTFGDLA